MILGVRRWDIHGAYVDKVCDFGTLKVLSAESFSNSFHFDSIISRIVFHNEIRLERHIRIPYEFLCHYVFIFTSQIY